MFFKNLSVLRLPSPWKMSSDDLEKAITKESFVPCTSIEPTRTGWVPPVPHGRLVHVVNKQFLLRLQTEKKLLPSSVVNQALADRAQEMEEQQGFKLGRKQKKELKENLIDEMLPKSWSILSTIDIWIDPVNGWLAVDGATNSKSELVMRYLLKAVPNLPMDTVHTQVSPTTAMTEWLLSDEAPSGFTVDDQTELTSAGESKATVAYKNQSVDASDLKKHIVNDGKKCTKLALTWNDRISFVLAENMLVKRISPLEVLTGETSQESASPEEMFDTDFTLMASELAKLLHDLTEALGGFAKEAKAA